jgi:hypothetical protein
VGGGGILLLFDTDMICPENAFPKSLGSSFHRDEVIFYKIIMCTKNLHIFLSFFFLTLAKYCKGDIEI